MKHRIKLISFMSVLLLFNSMSFGQKKVSYGGYFELGGESAYKEIYVESFFKAKLEYKLKLKDWAKVEIDIRANSKDREFELYEASASFKVHKNLEIEVGDLKKRYGIEEQTSREKLFTIDKSIINDYLEPLGFVSRDPGLQMHLLDEEERTNITAGAHFNESHRFTVMALVSSKDIFGIDKLGISFQAARERDNELSHSFAVNLNAEKDFSLFNCEVELFTGQDPLESYYRKLSGRDEMVEFFGARAQVKKKFVFENLFIEGIEPLLLGGFLVKDTDQFDVNSIQLLTGLNIYIDEDIRLMLNGNIVLTNHSYEKSERTLYGSNIIGQLQIRW